MYKEYFKEIFETSKSVIIPGLGSFSKANPSDPKITFNPYLKFNDGFLAGFIAKKQGIPMDDAGKLIAENVDRINEALEQKGEALVLGLGIIKKTGDGKLEFVSDNGGNNPAPPAPEIQKPVEKPTVKPVDPPKTEPKPEIKPEPKQPEIKPEPKQPEIKPVKEEKTVAPEIKKEEVKVNAPGLTNVEHTSAKDKKAKTPKPPKPPKEKRPAGEKKKSKFPVWLIVLLVLLAGGGTFAALKWDMVKGWIGMGDEKKEVAKTEEHTEEPVAVDTTAVAPDTTTVVEEPVVTEEPKNNTTKPVKTPPVKQNYSSSGSFHVIVNCFSIEQNATRFVEKLNAEGHQAGNIGLRGGFYMVEAGSYSSAEEAKSKLEAIKNTYPKAWIYAGS